MKCDFLADQLNTLKALGFTYEDCVEALEKCENKLDDAAIWLTHNANPVPGIVMRNKNSFSINAVEVCAICCGYHFFTFCLLLCFIEYFHG